MKPFHSIQKLIFLGLSLALFAQAALAGPPPRRGGAPEPRKPAGQDKRVCIDIGVSKPLVKTIPISRWPRNGRGADAVFLNVTTLVRNHSTTDLNSPVSVIVAFFDPERREWQPLAFETISRGIKAGKTERLNSGFYYDMAIRPEVVAMRAELVGTRQERNDCREPNDVSSSTTVNARSLQDAAFRAR